MLRARINISKFQGRDTEHLSMLLGELGPAPPQLPRKENRAINLPLFSRWESAIDGMADVWSLPFDG